MAYALLAASIFAGVRPIERSMSAITSDSGASPMRLMALGRSDQERRVPEIGT